MSCLSYSLKGKSLKFISDSRSISKTNTTDIYKNRTCKYYKTKTTLIAKYLKWATEDSTWKVTDKCS